MLPTGIFPKLILFVGTLAIYNAAQCFIPSMRMTPRIYALKKAEVTDLMSRMMGTWTFTSAVIRVYTAYNMNNPVAYQMCMWTYAIALASFFSEVFVYKTAPLRSPGVFPAMIISSTFNSLLKASSV
ncbi:ergosterol biosynthesis protein [Chytridiales sp. JEL 0842]|nr:ergosterol biosynthesis protein [Chytridiales sp. JEL 0842]